MLVFTYTTPGFVIWIYHLMNIWFKTFGVFRRQQYLHLDKNLIHILDRLWLLQTPPVLCHLHTGPSFTWYLFVFIPHLGFVTWVCHLKFSSWNFTIVISQQKIGLFHYRTWLHDRTNKIILLPVDRLSQGDRASSWMDDKMGSSFLIYEFSSLITSKSILQNSTNLAEDRRVSVAKLGRISARRIKSKMKESGNNLRRRVRGRRMKWKIEESLVEVAKN